MSEISSSVSRKESSSVSSSSKKVSSSVSSSSKISSSSLTQGLSSKLGIGSELAEIDSLLGSTSIGGNSSSTSSSTSSSSKKQSSSALSSINQSSFEGTGTGDHVKASVKSHSTSSSTSASLAQKSVSIDGELVSAETVADRSARKAESGKEKTIEDGVVTTDRGFKVEATSDAKLRATKEMSGAELDNFFRQPAITAKTPEALDFDKGSNSFQMKLGDLPEFSPQELVVKVVDGVISVVGSHTETSEDGTTKSHSYVRRFMVPEGLKPENVGWELDGSGVLQIAAGSKEYVKSFTSQVHLDCTIFKPRSFFKKGLPSAS